MRVDEWNTPDVVENRELTCPLGHMTTRSRASALLLALAVGACSGPPVPTRLDAGAVAYRAGEPAFVLDAVASVRDDATGIDVFLGLPPSSLVFRQSDGALVAVAQWTVTVEQEGRAPVALSPTDTVRVDDPGAARSGEPRWRVERVEVPPGAFTVRATVEDRASDRTAQRVRRVVVPGADTRPRLGGLRLEQADSTGSQHVDASGVPAGLDSLRVAVQAQNVPDGATTVLSLVRVRSDTTAAAPISAFTPSPSSLVGRGVDLGSVDTVQTVRQSVTNPDRALDVVAPLPALGPGVYRARVSLVGPDGAALDGSERLFVVRRRDYPAVSRLGDLVGPLAYLADDRDLRAIREAPTATARRRAFDAFWGERIDDRRLAAATVRAYYERVEEANRLFGTYKEGWKTDAGMAYVLFGPPSYVERTLDGERWTYGRGGAVPTSISFERTAGRPGDASAFEVLTLQRDRGYQDVWRAVRRQWRSGVVP